MLCPVSLVGNWSAEFKKWLTTSCPEILDPTRGHAFDSSLNKFAECDGHAVFICSYEAYRAREERFKSIALSLVTLDEAHKVKNHASGVTMSLQHLCAKRLLLMALLLSANASPRTLPRLGEHSDGADVVFRCFVFYGFWVIVVCMCWGNLVGELVKQIKY